MTATALEISYLDPMIPDKEIYLFQPGHIGMKVCEKGSGAWPSLPHFMMTHSISPFFEACNVIVSTSLSIIIYKTLVCHSFTPGSLKLIFFCIT
jgi:hypothetical protein